MKRAPGALDGREAPEVAATLWQNAQRLLEDPDLQAVLDPEWVAEWHGYWYERPDPGSETYDDEIAEIEGNRWYLAGLMGVPVRGLDGREAPLEARSDFAHDLLHMAAQVRGGHVPDMLGVQRHLDADRYQGDTPWDYPDWLAEAIVSDRLTPEPGKLRLVVVPKDEAFEYVRRHHSKLGRGYKLPPGTMYAVGAKKGERLVAVALAGHPTGQWRTRTDPRNVLELTRVASDGTAPNAASKLTARMIDLLPQSKRGDPKRPALFVTYSFADEPGAPYRALRDKGLRPTALVKGGDPHGARAGGAGRARETKIRWEAGPAAAPPDWGLINQLGLFA